MIAAVAVEGRPFISSESLRGAFFLGRNGEKCLIINIGPRVLVRKVRSAFSASICAGAFSGKRMPGTINASWRAWVLGSKCFLHSDAASAMVDSS